MSYEFWEEHRVEDTDMTDPNFRLSIGAYERWTEQLANGEIHMPGFREFMEKHKPDELRTPEELSGSSFTPDEK